MVSRLGTAILLAAAFAAVWAPFSRKTKPTAVVKAAPRVGHEMLATHCGDCHLGGTEKGDFSLENPSRADWENVRNQLRLGLMPPPARSELATTERTALVRWIEDESLAPQHKAPRGSSGLARRLNRVEYDNTIQQLLGISLQPSLKFPEDETAGGFDNIAAVQHTSPAHVEAYLRAAQESLAAAFDPILPKQQQIVVDPSMFPEEHLTYENNLTLRESQQFKLPVTTDHGGEGAATYQLQLTAYARPAGEEPPALQFGNLTLPLSGSRLAPDVVQAEITLEEGEHELVLGLANPYSNPADPSPLNRFRQAVFVRATLVGPFGLRGKSTPQATRWLAGVDFPAPAANQTELLHQRLTAFAAEATRRPLSAVFSKKLLLIVDQAATNALTASETARLAMTATLVSPEFLFIEPASVGTQLLDETSLATRLSYFLWKSPPDAELRKAAQEGRLRRELTKTVERMLLDGRSHSLARDFMGQWLQLRNIRLAQPDADQFPDWSPSLAEACDAELVAFCQNMLTKRRPLRDFLLAEDSFANATLAKHYGLKELSQGDALEPVSLQGTFRRGLLGKAGVLTMTSQPTRTSPVSRGKWVLECLLGMSPPPPPPNIPTLDAEATNHQTMSQRQLLEAHRTQAGCVNCHACLDPYGFALEKYDAIGRWRFHDAGAALDVSARLPNGKHLQGADELSQYLATNHMADFRQHLAASLLAYATGETVGTADLGQIREIMRIGQAGGDHLAAYIHGVVRSVLFQTTASPP
jgi:hypothetical protein